MLTVLEKVDVLHNAEVFREIRTESLARVAAIAQEVTFGPREVLFMENESAESMYVVLDGEVVLGGAGREEHLLKELQIAGALPVLADLPQTDTARASKPTRALRIRQSDLYDVMSEDFQITRGVLRALAGSVSLKAHQ